MLMYFERICKPFKQFVEHFEWIFLGVRTDEVRITNGSPFEWITVSVRFAFHSHKFLSKYVYLNIHCVLIKTIS